MSEQALWSDGGPRDPDFLDAPGYDLESSGFDPLDDDDEDDELDEDEEFLHG